MSQLSALLDELTRDEEGTRMCMDIPVGNSVIKNCINEHHMPEIFNLCCTVANLENRMDGMKNIRYFRTQPEMKLFIYYRGDEE